VSGHVVALLGGTASGKTAAAIEVARRMPVEIVSADSRQLRREMRIGTAAPSDEELAAVPHHLVGVIAPDAPWTLANFLERALGAFEEIQVRGNMPLLVGGTGQYVWALLEGWEVPGVPPDPALRAGLAAEVAEHGLEALHARLARLDPASADRIDARNERRVVRAIEIIEATGAPVAPLVRREPPFSWRTVGIARPRDVLHERADARAEHMYRDGLVDETRALVGRYGREFEALRSIGYADALRLLDGELDEAAALEHTRTETHRLIRMQATWFRSDDERIEWRDGADGQALADAVVAAAGAPVR
jgi:tRNA dimethylallyltransferase